MFELQLLPGNYMVCRLAPDEPVPAWALGDLVSTTRTPEELSIVCRDTDVHDRGDLFQLATISGLTMCSGVAPRKHVTTWVAAQVRSSRSDSSE